MKKPPKKKNKKKNDTSVIITDFVFKKMLLENTSFAAKLISWIGRVSNINNVTPIPEPTNIRSLVVKAPKINNDFLELAGIKNPSIINQLLIFYYFIFYQY